MKCAQNLSQKGWSAVGLLALLLAAAPVRATDIERPPIRYGSAPVENAVSRLQARIDAGRSPLTWEEGHGYLRSLLRELHVPESSQMLVFSKTSLQRQRIAPKRPRAIYFGDDAYVGFCQHGDLLEVTAIDPQMGPIFYSLDRKEEERPQFVRQTDNCLLCHASSQNLGSPGLLVRSVYADGLGLPILASGSYRIDHTSPLEKRWGGWYVTGTSGKQAHLGNLIVRGRERPEAVDNKDGVNVTDLSRFCKTAPYLTPHSDIVALMVLEHQTEMHNRIARANWQTRLALHEEVEINKALGRPADYHSESTAGRIKSAGEPLVQYLLMSGEAALTDEVRGTSGFAEEFARRATAAAVRCASWTCTAACSSTRAVT